LPNITLVKTHPQPAIPVPPIEHVSDTARWIAAYRAMESERPDALFRDPFARRLGGARGAEIVATLPRGRASAWALVVRTAVFDEVVRERVASGEVDLVVNLAAGLDTRPWRLDLPRALRWVDVDHPGILDFKARELRGEAPRCRYAAVAADLTDPGARDALFARLGASSARALVITEGLLVYLEPSQVADLARALAAVPGFRWWLSDLANTRLLAMLRRQWGGALERGNAPMRFAVDDPAAFFAPLGWRVAWFRAAIDEARRLRREMPRAWLTRFLIRVAPAATAESMRRTAGFVLLDRPSSDAGTPSSGWRAQPARTQPVRVRDAARPEMP
jgi:methyltransferase (TIGR00027 family)